MAIDLRTTVIQILKDNIYPRKIDEKTSSNNNGKKLKSFVRDYVTKFVTER